jgi:hypothetical protein
MATATASAPSSTSTDNMIVLDLGKHKRKQVKRLRRGEASNLLREVQVAVQDLRDAGTISASAETVVVVVRQKPRRAKKKLNPLF